MSELEFWHHHGGVSVPDLDAAIRWWRTVLGFELERRRTLEPSHCEMAMVRNGDLRIELFQAPDGGPPSEDRSQPDADLQTWGNKHVSFAVADVPAFAATLKRRGADIVWVKTFEFGANIFIRDNAGNLVEFVQAERPTQAISKL